MKILLSLILGLSVLQAQVKEVKIGTQEEEKNNPEKIKMLEHIIETNKKIEFVKKLEEYLKRSSDSLMNEINKEMQSMPTFKEVKIGTQVWMAENLNVSTFRNGDPIPQANTAEEWAKADENQQPAWCYYDDDRANGTKYGKLYNWYAVNDARGLAPAGYHIPTEAEWTKLTTYLGGKEVAGTKMKSTSGWNENGNGTNSSGFNGLPGGLRNRNGPFYYVGEDGCWWSSTEANTYDAWSLNLNSNYGDVTSYYDYKGNGFYVRCLRD